ncbi:MAG TPA: hypothetical protein VM368_07010, partial [Flavisolibacter sp.]|nr:hypothetical protein [Flavisolibacter sp.]
MSKRFFSLAFVIISAIQTTSAQQNLTAADYARAEKMMGYNTNQLVDGLAVQPNWLAGDRFWYRVLTPQGSEFIMVDP